MATCRNLILLLFIAGFIASGCATEAPATEGLVFAGKQKKTTQSTSNTIADKLSVDVTSGYARIIPPGTFRRAASTRFSAAAADTLSLAPSHLFAIPFVPSVAPRYGNRIALGSDIFPLPGFWQLDGSVRLFRQYYLTLSKKLFQANTQFILERRLWYKNHGGFSMGAFYRRDPFTFKSSFLQHGFSVSWFGLRSLFQTPGGALDDENGNIHLRGIFSGGYVPELKAPLFVIGIQVGFHVNLHPGKHRRHNPGPAF